MWFLETQILNNLYIAAQSLKQYKFNWNISAYSECIILILQLYCLPTSVKAWKHNYQTIFFFSIFSKIYFSVSILPYYFCHKIYDILKNYINILENENKMLTGISLYCFTCKKKCENSIYLALILSIKVPN